MAKRKGSYTFHGAFTDKEEAKKKAKKVGGNWQEISVNGKPRFTVYVKH